MTKHVRHPKGSTVTVASWEELQRELFLNAPSGYLKRFRSPFAFRGLDKAEYPLTTTLARLNNCWTVNHHFAEIEDKLLAAFRMYSQEHKQVELTFWYWLSVAQHHGLPMRLLNWTWSPYIALHFATAKLGINL